MVASQRVVRTFGRNEACCDVRHPAIEERTMTSDDCGCRTVEPRTVYTIGPRARWLSLPLRRCPRSRYTGRCVLYGCRVAQNGPSLQPSRHPPNIMSRGSIGRLPPGRSRNVPILASCNSAGRVEIGSPTLLALANALSRLPRKVARTEGTVGSGSGSPSPELGVSGSACCLRRRCLLS